MVRMTNVKVSVHSIIGEDGVITGEVSEKEKEAIIRKICKSLRCDREGIRDLQIEKRSIDARKKGEVNLVYTVLFEMEGETAFQKRVKDKDVSFPKKDKGGSFGLRIPDRAIRRESDSGLRPVIVGMGPAGLFCAYKLAEEGFSPILLERGMDVDARVGAVNRFWETNEIHEDSNVQFGEGGAGTFSDGKLNTTVRNASGLGREALHLFVEHGAPPEILYLAKPHIGTDKLRNVVKNIRKKILSLGGEVRFLTKLESLEVEKGKVIGCRIKKVDSNDAPSEFLPCETLVLAIGHSARDTFAMLYENKVEMVSKAFAIGVRMEHLQSRINASQYGELKDKLPPADYKLTHRTKEGRGVYSFCMCPGGFVVNASSEKDGLAINGMSNYNRGERNANGAIVVTVSGEDFKNIPYQNDVPEALMGMEFQRTYEKLAFQLAGGLIPVQRFGDFERNRESKGFGLVTPDTKGSYGLANVRSCLPSYVGDAVVEGVRAFDRKIGGFADPDAVISGVETRTSSPVRIIRDESLQSNIKGLYPCGEGAGYAGGIMSAAMDGLKVAATVMGK